MIILKLLKSTTNFKLKLLEKIDLTITYKSLKDSFIDTKENTYMIF